MISRNHHTAAWIGEQSRRIKARDAEFLEKCILAFELVSRLAEAGLEFVFKGGTCLLLHVQPIRRLSTDVDIATGATVEELSALLARITKVPPFDRGFSYRQERDRENPPTRYFAVPYQPVMGKRRPLDEIQLDVLIKQDVYPNTERKPLALDFMEPEREVLVTVPTIDSLLGDKLTAFAPSTVGLLYHPLPRQPGAPPPAPRPLNVLKQVFDIGVLFEHARDLRVVAAAYARCLAIQQRARQPALNCTRAQALDDTVDAAAHLAALELGDITNEKTAFFGRGVIGLDNHLLGGKFNTRTAQIPAARAALLATLLKAGRTDLSFDELRALPAPAELAQLQLPADWARYARLRKLAPEAFYRWHQVATLMLAAT